MRLLPRTDAVSVDPEEAQILVSQAFVSQCFQVFTVTVITYDIMTTMDNEIKYFWKTPIKMPTLVYFANRYIGLLGAVFYSFFNTLDASPALPVFGLVRKYCYEPVNYPNRLHLNASSLRIVLSRHELDYAHVKHCLIKHVIERVISLFLKVLLALAAVLKMGITIYVVQTLSYTAGEIGGNIRICGFIGSEPVQWGMAGWIVPLIYAAILMTMALYKAAEFWRLSSGLTGFTLVKVLVVDQFLYFVTVLMCCMFNILIFKLDIPNEYLTVVFTILGNPSFLSLLGSRLLVNLKKAGERGLNEGTNYRVPSKTLSGIIFA